MITYSIITLLALVAIIQSRYIFKYIRKKGDSLLLLFDIKNSPKNFYYHNLKGGKSYFSDNLSKSLSISASSDISSLKPLLSDSHYRLVNNLIIEQSSENAQYIDINIMLEATLEGNQKKYFQCRYDYVLDNFKQKTALIIWLDDVTKEIDLKQRFNSDNLKLKQEVAKLTDFLNRAPFPIWQRDSSTNIIYFNFAYSNIVAQEGEMSLDVTSLEISSSAKELARKAMETNQPFTEELHVINNGKRCLFHISEVPFESGITLGFGYDISAKEKIKHELDRYILAQSELLESSASAMAIYSSDTRIKFFNQAFIKLWDLDEIWLGTHPTYSEILEELRERRKLPEQENFVEFKKSHLKFFTELFTPHNEFFYLPDGTALRVLIIAHALGGLLFAYEDMTDHLTLERSYNTLIAVQKTTLDKLQEAIAVFGANGRLKLYNNNYATMWNFKPQFLDQEPHIIEIFDHTKLYFENDSWELYKSDLQNTISNRKQSEITLEIKNNIMIKKISVPLPDGALLITYLDITDTMMLERSLIERNQALYDADKTKSEFLANISYELRSPLTSISGFAEILNKQYFGALNPKQKEYVEDINYSSQYLMSLVNDVLDLASIEAGYLELELSRFDIYQSISSVLPIVNERMKDKKIEFSFECVSYFGMVIGDEKRLKQVVLKLLSNAIKFDNEGGKITLSVSEPYPGKVDIIVEDTGIGIDLEEQRLVFDKFYKQSAHKMAKSGAGLGLSLVKSFVELHHGSITIDSEYDIGTRIICSFEREHPELAEILDKFELASLSSAALSK